MFDTTNDYWKLIYTRDKVSRGRAADLVLDYHHRSQQRPIPHNLWGSFYAEASGAYLHKKLSGFLLGQQNNFCSYCKEKIYHGANLNIEHVFSRKKYPQFTFTLKNLSAICITCNAIKSSKDYHNLDEDNLDYARYEIALTCYHPNYHDFDSHINMLVIQTNRIYVRTYVGKSMEGKEFCKAHLNSLTTFAYKKAANPGDAAEIEKLARFIANSNKPNEAARKMLSTLIEKF